MVDLMVYLPKHLKFSYANMYSLGYGLTGTKAKERLTRTLSTKLSIKEYNTFRVLTNLAYQHHDIKEDSQSEMLRLLIAIALDEIRNHPGYSLMEVGSEIRYS
jgi:pyruvate formate-lyase activating enzyme-like uncharacterized protein